MKNSLLIASFLVCGLFTGYAQETKSPKKKIQPAPAEEAIQKPTKKSKNKPVDTQAPTPKREVAPAAENPEPGLKNTAYPLNEPKQPTSQPELSKFVKPVVSKQNNGSIDWTNQYIEAKGEALIDLERFKNPAQARAMATRGATVVSQRNLLEIINGVYVVGETTVQDMITTSDLVQTRVEGVLRGAQMVGEPVEKNGMMEVTMRVPLYQTNGLAPAVFDQLPKLRNETTPVTVQASMAEEAKFNSNEELQNVIFNLTGKKFDPAMFPVITDENNQLLLDLSKYYDPNKGDFPRIMEASKEVLNLANIKNGTEIIELVQANNGKFVVSEKVAKKINWKKVGGSIAKVGSFLMLLL